MPADLPQPVPTATLSVPTATPQPAPTVRRRCRPRPLQRRRQRLRLRRSSDWGRLGRCAGTAGCVCGPLLLDEVSSLGGLRRPRPPARRAGPVQRHLAVRSCSVSKYTLSPAARTRSMPCRPADAAPPRWPERSAWLHEALSTAEPDGAVIQAEPTEAVRISSRPTSRALLWRPAIIARRRPARATHGCMTPLWAWGCRDRRCSGARRGCPQSCA